MSKNVKAALIIGGITVAVLIILSSVFGLVWGWQVGGWGMMGGFSWWLFPIFMILFWGLVIWSIVALVWGPSGSIDSNSSTVGSALEVLRRRYARSEISKEEYEDKRKDIA